MAVEARAVDAHAARGEPRHELAQSFVRHRLFLPVAGHRGAVPRWSIQKCASRTLAGRMAPTVGRGGDRTYARSAFARSRRRGYARAMRSLVVLVALAVKAPSRTPAPRRARRSTTSCAARSSRRTSAALHGAGAPIQLGGSSDCAFFPRGGNALVNGVRVFLRIDDGDQTLWKHKATTRTARSARWWGSPRMRSAATSPAGSRRSSTPDAAPSHAR